MNSNERIEALFLIQEQLQQWVSHAPEDYVQTYGMTSANISIQRCKQLISHELQVQALEETVEINQSLGLYSIE